MKQYVIYPDWIQDSKLKTKCSSNRQKTITTKSLLSLHGYFAGWSLHGLAACRFKTMTSTTGAYSSFSLFLFLDASNCLFFPRLSRHFVTRFQACQEKCTLDSTFFFNSAPPIRATRNGHMGCWKSKTWKGLWKACRSFDFIQDKQPFMNTSSLSEKRRASGDIAPVSSLTRTAMCIFYQNNCSILQKHSS